MLERRPVQQQIVCFGTELERREVREIRLLRFSQVMHQGAGGADCRAVAIRRQAEAVERYGPQLVVQRAGRVLQIERPGRRAGDVDSGVESGQRGRCPVLGWQQQLARTERRQFVCDRCRGGSAGVLRDTELARRQIGRRQSVCRKRLGCASRVHRGDRHQKHRLTGFQVPAVGQRAGRDDAHDLPANQSFRLPGVFHLLAKRDPVSLADEADQIAVDCVVWNTAHRNLAPRRILRARRKRQLQFARGGHGVVKEELVEVAHAKKNQGVRMLRLRVEVLTHRGGGVAAGLLRLFRRGGHCDDGSIATAGC